MNYNILCWIFTVIGFIWIIYDIIMNIIADNIVHEPLSLMKNIFYTKDEQPNNELICVYYNHEYYFDMYKPINEDYVFRDGNDKLLWKDIDYWCYMSDIEKILEFAYNQEYKED